MAAKKPTPVIGKEIAGVALEIIRDSRTWFGSVERCERVDIDGRVGFLFLSKLLYAKVSFVDDAKRDRVVMFTGRRAAAREEFERLLSRYAKP